MSERLKKYHGEALGTGAVQPQVGQLTSLSISYSNLGQLNSLLFICTSEV